MDFDRASRISFINDEGLRMYLGEAQKKIDSDDYRSASCLVAGAFEYASISISSFIPKSSSEFFITSRLGRAGSASEVKDAIKDTLKRVDEVEHFSALLASGVSLSDYKKYKDSSPFAQIMLAGNIIYQTYAGKVFDKGSTTWLYSFVVNTLIKWQQLGLSPQIPDYLREAAIKSLDE